MVQVLRRPHNNNTAPPSPPSSSSPTLDHQGPRDSCSTSEYDNSPAPIRESRDHTHLVTEGTQTEVIIR